MRMIREKMLPEKVVWLYATMHVKEQAAQLQGKQSSGPMVFIFFWSSRSSHSSLALQVLAD